MSQGSRRDVAASRIDGAVRYTNFGASLLRIADEVCPRRISACHRLKHELPNGVALALLFLLGKAHLVRPALPVVPGEIPSIRLGGRGLPSGFRILEGAPQPIQDEPLVAALWHLGEGQVGAAR